MPIVTKNRTSKAVKDILIHILLKLSAVMIPSERIINRKVHTQPT